MKIIEEKKNFKSNIDDSEIVKYGITDLGFIFDILRNKLYSNKIRTPVQEYASNGRDAQREAKSKKPIEIWFPSLSSLTFAVRDYGPGLTPDRIKEVFCMYGSSTKRATNTQVGGMGIGGKSAFSYTDSFTIESFVDGTKRTYVSHLGDDKRGQIDLMSEVATDEPNGVKVSYAIKRQDVNEFAEAIIRTTMFWDEAEYPVFHNVAGFKTRIDESRAVGVQRFMGTNLSGVCRNDWQGRDKTYIIIDGIPYEAPNTNPQELSKLKKLCNSEQEVLNIFIPNGMMSISASREKIDDSEVSRKAFKQILVAATADFEAARQQWDDKIVDSKAMLSAQAANAGFILSSKKSFDYVTFKNNQYNLETERTITDTDGVKKTEVLWKYYGLTSKKMRDEAYEFDIVGKHKYYLVRNGAVSLDDIRTYVRNNNLGQIDAVVIEGRREKITKFFKEDGVTPLLDDRGQQKTVTTFVRIPELVNECIEILERLGFKNIEEIVKKTPKEKKEKTARKRGNIMRINLQNDVDTILTFAEVDELKKTDKWIYYVGTKQDYKYKKFLDKASRLNGISDDFEFAWRVLEKHEKLVKDDPRFIEAETYFNSWTPGTKLVQQVAIGEICRNTDLNILKNILSNHSNHNCNLYKAANCIESKDKYFLDWDTKNLVQKSPNYKVIKDKIDRLVCFVRLWFPLFQYSVIKSEHNKDYLNWTLDKAAKSGVNLSAMDIV